jgi:hypothetical protein
MRGDANDTNARTSPEPIALASGTVSRAGSLRPPVYEDGAATVYSAAPGR